MVCRKEAQSQHSKDINTCILIHLGYPLGITTTSMTKTLPLKVSSFSYMYIINLTCDPQIMHNGILYTLRLINGEWKKTLQHNKTDKNIKWANILCWNLFSSFFFYYFSCWPCRMVFFLQIETIAWPSLTTWVERTWGIWWCLRTRMTTKCISRNKERKETNGTGLIWTYIWTSVPL